MKKYFKYQLKKSLVPLAVLTAFAMLMYVLPLLIEDYSYWNSQDQHTYISLFTGNILTALGIMCGIVPIYMLNYRMKKRSVDMYYSLPLSRVEILAVHFIVGFLTVLAAYSAAYWLGFVIVFAKVKRLQYIYYLLMYLASLIPAFIIYALAAFSFTRANTLADGIIFVILTHCALFMVMTVVQLVMNNIKGEYSYLINPGAFMISGPLIRVGEVLGGRIHYPYDQGYHGWSLFKSWSTTPTRTYNIVHDAVVFGTLALAATGATVAMFLTEKNCKAENCGQISESIFGYKTLIPIYTAVFIILLTEALDGSNSGNNIIAWCVIAFCAYLMTVIYRRSLKIGKIQAIMLAVYLSASLTAAVIINSI